MAHDRCSKCGGSAYKVCSGCYDRALLQNEGMQKALKEIAGSPSSYLWATLTGIAREALDTYAKKPFCAHTEIMHNTRTDEHRCGVCLEMLPAVRTCGLCD